MLKLHGFSLSNYYNKVKLALLEKGVPFEEVLVPTAGCPVDRGMSPLGKVPYLETEHGSLCESQVILDYIEARYPTPALLPTDPWRAAKHREIITFLELHVELCARQLYAQAFFGGTLPDKFLARVKGDLVKNLAAFKPLAVFGPYVAGDTFSAADCAAYVHLPLAGLATKIVYGEDLVVAAGIDWKTYVKLIEQRPTAQKVAADRKADQARATAVTKAAAAGG
ncbi:glutathione S-transferase family protein [Aquabacterium sp. CECT 9606]|uniref:glutathione S-transferase family protein n=1 Tax=Aquabacterium sp. CECT 9606 TaxID=2845822 RepID=UPI001E62BC19|nr:glutathione S-transferase [Aquabacterium sp. CECT 9606]CAH0347795.1 Glutathione S-transferase [Aquabacterium sp. CECT 9606]